MKENPWTVSNVLSASRIFLMAPVVYFFLSPMEHNREYAVLFTLLAVTTDALDGYFARLFHQESELGKIIDPLADKIGVGIVVVLLLIFGDIPLWFALLVLCRDILIFLGGLYIQKRTGIILASNMAGKFAVSFVALTLVLSMVHYRIFSMIQLISLYASVVLLVFSFITIHTTIYPCPFNRKKEVPIMSFFDSIKLSRLKNSLVKTRDAFVTKISKLVFAKGSVDDDFLRQLEEILIGADVGVETTQLILSSVKQQAKEQRYENPEELNALIRASVSSIFANGSTKNNAEPFATPATSRPYVIMVVGVNGVGKTTTIGKLAFNYKAAGKKVLIGAADTFRAAANEQLEIWAQRAGVTIIQQVQGSDLLPSRSIPSRQLKPATPMS